MNSNDQLRTFYVLSETHQHADVVLRLEGRELDYFTTDSLGEREFDYVLRASDVETEKTLAFSVNKRYKLRSVLPTEYLGVYALHHDVIEKLRLCGLTGWIAQNIRLMMPDGSSNSEYCTLRVTGKCGPIDWKRSVRRVPPSEVSASSREPVWWGLYFDEATWDGSDFFCAADYKAVFVSDRVRQCFDLAGITAFNLRPLTEVYFVWMPERWRE